MKSDIELLEMYKEEKALVIGSPSERTGLEPFPSFKEWKAEYVKEYAETHDIDNPMTMEEAVAAIEAELGNELIGDDLLDEEDLEAAKAVVQPTEEEDEMTEAATEAATEAVTEKATVTSTKKPKSAKGKATATTAAAPSKASKAREIFNKLYPQVIEGKKARKDVIAAFVDKAGLTAAGASTYYQKFKKSYSA